MPKRHTLVSRIAYSTTDKVVVKDRDLCKEILGKHSLGDVAFLLLTDRMPTERESIMFNALAVCLVEHGLTPSAIVTRLTMMGAPESMQAAVAAGLNGLGSLIAGSMEAAARVLQGAIPDPKADVDIDALARQILEQHKARKAIVPGIGHRVHKPVDPRAERLYEIARETGYDGPYMKLMWRLSALASEAAGRELPVNATGGIAAAACEMGLPWNITRGLAVMGRAVGLVGHVREELAHPIGREVMLHAIQESNKNAGLTGSDDGD